MQTTAQQHATRATLALIVLLFSVPYLTPIHRAPISTFDGELLVAFTLGAAMIVGSLAKPAATTVAWPMPSVALVFLLVAIVQGANGMLQYSYAKTSFLIYICGLLSAYLFGRWIVASNLRDRAMTAIAIGLVIGALLQVNVQFLQVFDVRGLPHWLVFSTIEKIVRPFGNLGQPNLLATLLVWATLAAAFLARTKTFSARVSLIAATLFFCGLALTGSRMGTLFAVLTIVMTLTPNALTPKHKRERQGAALALVIGYGVGLVVANLAVTGSGTAVERFGEASFGYRLSMWLDAGRIALAHPLLGTGVGEYGNAQLWLAAAHPSVLGTNNPHNLVLHIAAELGLPAALFMVGTICWWCWRHRHAWRADATSAMAYCCILVVLAHSMLEYPLWILHFLVAFGIFVAVVEAASIGQVKHSVRARWVLIPVGVATLATAMVMKLDYDDVAPIWDTYLRNRMQGNPHGPETILGVTAVKSSTYFKPQMDRLYVELFPVTNMQGDENIDISARILSRMADTELIERHILLLLQAGRIKESLPYIARLKIFAGSRYPDARARVERAISLAGDVVDPVRKALAAP